MPKVALCIFPLNFMGGVVTRTWTMARGLRKNGVQADVIRLTRSPIRPFELEAVEPTVFAESPRGALVLRHYMCSYNEKFIAQTIRRLFQYDVVVFVHAAPHPSTDGENRTWQRLFTQLKSRKVVIFSDVYWQEYYPWVQEVMGAVSEAFGTNAAASAHLKATGLVKEPRTLHHPFDVHPVPPSAHPTRTREKRLVWACQWRGWKGLHLVWKALPTLGQQGWAADMFGYGRERIEMAQQEDWVSTVGKDYASDPPSQGKGMATVYGTAAPSQVYAAYSQGMLACDFTGASEKYYGHYNRTHLEPMGFGCPVVCRPTVLVPHSPIPPEVVWTASSTEELLEVCAEIERGGERVAQKTAAAYEYIRPRATEVYMREVLEQWLALPKV